jgi:hypothetical protein
MWILIQAYKALESVYKEEATPQATKDVMKRKINTTIELNKALQRQITGEELAAVERAWWRHLRRHTRRWPRRR